MANLIPQIAQMLGVELNEEFKIKGRKGAIYKFIVDELLVSDDDAEKAYIATHAPLVGLVKGDIEIVKLPWKPKKGDVYFTFVLMVVLMGDKWVVRSSRWGGLPNEYALLDKGWVYRTEAEAQDALPKVAAEMGVEYEL